MHLGDLTHEHLQVAAASREVEPLPPREARGRRLDALADAPRGLVRPRNGDAKIAQRRLRRRLELRDERLHHGDALGDRSRHRPGVVVARRERPAALQRDEPVRRLEPDDAAVRGRDPDRAAGIRAERGIRESRRERRGGAAARAAGNASLANRIRNPAVVRVHGCDPVRELVKVRLADVDVARGLEQAHGLGRLLWYVLGEDRGAVGRDQSRGIEEVLDRERDAGRRFSREREEDALR